MTNREAVIWLINITADIGKIEHQGLWHYEQALTEIREMLENMPTIEPQTEQNKRELEEAMEHIRYLQDQMSRDSGIIEGLKYAIRYHKVGGADEP